MDIRKHQLSNDNWLTPCTIIDRPEFLREVVKKHGAHPTHKGAETIIEGEIASYLDRYAQELDRITRPEFEKMVQGKYDSSVVELSKVIRNHREKNKKEFEVQKRWVEGKI